MLTRAELTVPAWAAGLLVQSDAGKVEPLIGTVWIVTGNHISVTHIIAETVQRFSWSNVDVLGKFGPLSSERAGGGRHLSSGGSLATVRLSGAGSVYGTEGT